MSEKTPFNEWFNPNSKEHMAALVNYLQHGEWPKHFLPADVSFHEAGEDQTDDLYETLKRVAVMWFDSFGMRYRESSATALEFGGSDKRG